MSSKIPAKFIDEDDTSDEDDTNDTNDIVPVNKPVVKKVFKSIIGDKQITDYIFANTNTYSFKTWHQCFSDKKVNLRALVFNPTWYEFFDIIETKPYYEGMERILSKILTKNNESILPHAELVFNMLNMLSPKRIKVVIMGQDPYPGISKIDGKSIPQAMGFSFSVPLNFPKPPSLDNIYKNLLEFKHVAKIPESGCLSYWILQGCFMVNASFTTIHTKKNVHKEIWKNFTDDLLTYINNNCTNVVFAVWGSEAHKICQNIDPLRHHIITSSHPSPLAYDKTFSGLSYGKNKKQVTYQPFKSIDHFGKINDYLKTVNKREIIWDLCW